MADDDRSRSGEAHDADDAHKANEDSDGSGLPGRTSHIGALRSNFAFLQADWPPLFDAAVRAERFAHADPRAACFYARRGLEFTVHWLFDHDGTLNRPYARKLGAMVYEPTLRTLVGTTVHAKMQYILSLGNRAVHEPASVQPREAVRIVGELFHTAYWLARTYTSRPAAELPAVGIAFDTGLIPRPLPADVRLRKQKELREEAAEDQARYERNVQQLAAERAENEELRRQLAETQARIAAVKEANQSRADEHDYDEEQTRDRFIDLLLNEAGWPLDKEWDIEFPVTGMPTPSGKGRVDYVLWGDDGRPLGIVEAKRTRRDATDGRRQAELYADCLEQMYGQRPVILYTNGYEHFIWDDRRYAPRPIQGFRTKDELHWLIQQRTGRKALGSERINEQIVDRPYQHRAIRRVGEAFEDGQRQALLVMATGTGKTRTTVALVDQLMKAGWARRVLFLCDRQALVNQACSAFKRWLPQTPLINLLEEKSTDGRVFVSTYPTMMNLIDSITADGRRRFGPGFFDLVVIDEAHRSVYQKYGQVFEYFDSLLLGLTATPKDEIDRNTYRLFELEEGVPTDSYSLAEAAEEGYLVQPKTVEVSLKFQRTGIRYDDLSEEEKTEWDALEWGEDGQVPQAVTPEEVNKYLFNTDTVDQALETLVYHGHGVEGGDRLGKTIVFAKNNAHAQFIAERYDANYPRQAGHTARVVTYREKYAQSLIEDFSDPAKAPDIAISVDMMDTGIDVPEVLNLVFFKPVYSKTKFWQMIGRGTRLCENVFGPGLDKEDFYVFDLCGNFEYFNQELDRSPGRRGPSLTERILQQQLELVRVVDRRQQPDVTQDAGPDGNGSEQALRWALAHRLHRTVSRMRPDNFLVRPHRWHVEVYSDFRNWHRLDEQAHAVLSETVLPLPTEYAGEGTAECTVEGGARGEDAKRFDLLAFRLQLAALEGHSGFGKLRADVQEIAGNLLEKTAVPAVRAQQVLLEALSGDEWWQEVTVPMLEDMRRRVRGLTLLVDKKAKHKPLYTDFEDELVGLAEVELRGVPQGTDEQLFRRKARAYLARHADQPVVRKLYGNEQIDGGDLTALEEIFLAEGIGSEADLRQVREIHGGLGVFVRSLRGLDRQAVQDAFSGFVAGRVLSSRQLDFLGLITDYLHRNGAIEVGALYETPFTHRSPGGPEELFAEDEIDELAAVFGVVRARALPASATA